MLAARIRHLVFMLTGTMLVFGALLSSCREFDDDAHYDARKKNYGRDQRSRQLVNQEVPPVEVHNDLAPTPATPPKVEAEGKKDEELTAAEESDPKDEGEEVTSDLGGVIYRAKFAGTLDPKELYLYYKPSFASGFFNAERLYHYLETSLVTLYGPAVETFLKGKIALIAQQEQAANKGSIFTQMILKRSAANQPRDADGKPIVFLESNLEGTRAVFHRVLSSSPSDSCAGFTCVERVVLYYDDKGSGKTFCYIDPHSFKPTVLPLSINPMDYERMAGLIANKPKRDAVRILRFDGTNVDCKFTSNITPELKTDVVMEFKVNRAADGSTNEVEVMAHRAGADVANTKSMIDDDIGLQNYTSYTYLPGELEPIRIVKKVVKRLAPNFVAKGFLHVEAMVSFVKVAPLPVKGSLEEVAERVMTENEKASR